MAAIDLTGYWSGLAVTRTLHAVVHIYLEQRGTRLTGKFDSPDLPGENSSGDVEGSFDGATITLRSPRKIEFQGQFVGQTTVRGIVYGVLQGENGEEPGGTLTLFRREEGPVTQLYDM